MTPSRVSAPAEGKDIPMRDQQNRNARRKRLLRQILRLAGMAVLAAVVVFLAIRVVDALRSSGGGDASGRTANGPGRMTRISPCCRTPSPPWWRRWRTCPSARP